MEICPASDVYKEENRFVFMSPFKRKKIHDFMVVFCHCPGGTIFPIVDSVNGMVGGEGRDGNFNGVAFAEIMYYGDEGYLCTPGINVSIPPVRVEMAGDLMAARLRGSDWQPVYMWCEARKKCLCEQPVPDGRKFGQVSGGKVASLPLSTMESLYDDLIHFHLSQL